MRSSRKHKTSAEHKVSAHHAKVALVEEMKREGTYVPQKPKVNTSAKKRNRR